MINIKEELNALVSIPSYGAGDLKKENRICEYLSVYIKNNLSDLTIRYNETKDGIRTLVALGSDNPEILLACHMDTVPPSNSSQLSLSVQGDKAFGLGTKDMKGGIVASLLALEGLQDLKKAGLVFYSDEEYEQKGMLCAVEFLKDELKIKPKLIISPESRFNIGYGARGIIVLTMKVTGKKAHSARPHLGIDAIDATYKILQKLKDEFSEYESQLGYTTFTLSFISGGSLMNDSTVEDLPGSIPDVCLSTISVRNANKKLNSKNLSSYIIKIAKELNVEVELKVQTDHPVRETDILLVNKLRAIAKQKAGFDLELGDPKLAGYNDAAILAQAMDVPVINFGPYGEDNHTQNEWVSLNSIKDTANVLRLWIENF